MCAAADEGCCLVLPWPAADALRGVPTPSDGRLRARVRGHGLCELFISEGRPSWSTSHPARRMLLSCLRLQLTIWPPDVHGGHIAFLGRVTVPPVRVSSFLVSAGGATSGRAGCAPASGSALPRGPSLAVLSGTVWDHEEASRAAADGHQEAGSTDLEPGGPGAASVCRHLPPERHHAGTRRPAGDPRGRRSRRGPGCRRRPVRGPVMGRDRWRHRGVAPGGSRALQRADPTAIARGGRAGRVIAEELLPGVPRRFARCRPPLRSGCPEAWLSPAWSRVAASADVPRRSSRHNTGGAAFSLGRGDCAAFWGSRPPDCADETEPPVLPVALP